MRLFIAICFKENIVEKLEDIQADLLACGVTGKCTPPENLHLTLAFVGEYGNPDDILEVMESVPFRKMELQLVGLQHFRDMYFARFEENVGLQSYVRRLRRALADNGITFDKKKFKPHITLMRKVSLANADFDSLPQELNTGIIRASGVSLMLSERGKKGMIYTELGVIEDR
ncbi:MAG: RNA 2',3'-cyclic phosphodiesterase [Butyrivibrio sp.]|nr:RNA 2',3'-cyclic phosphodiesterase [Butyrivibrio sp.]